MGNAALIDILTQFRIPKGDITVQTIKGGRINATYKVTISTEKQLDSEYVLQVINSAVFHQPEIIMQNLNLLAQSMVGEELKSLSFIHTNQGTSWHIGADGQLYRVMPYIENSEPDRSQAVVFYEAGKAVGEFHAAFWDFPADKLVPVIPDFHHTEKRFQSFEQIRVSAKPDRVEAAGNEISFLLEYQSLAKQIIQPLETGKLPLRVTHNDTKIENILFSAAGEHICLIDFDTVMPGAAAWDFGDSIRSMTNLATEEETDMQQVRFSFERFVAYAQGYAAVMDNKITPEEAESLIAGCLVITYEQGLRFLTDYLNNDQYYPINYPQQNLVRARVQLTLLRQMLEQQQKMGTAIKELFPFCFHC